MKAFKIENWRRELQIQNITGCLFFKRSFQRSYFRGTDLLTECENWRRELQIQNITGCLDTGHNKDIRSRPPHGHDGDVGLLHLVNQSVQLTGFITIMI